MTTPKTKTCTEAGTKMSRAISAARREDWKTQPMPEGKITREINRFYSAGDAGMIRHGSMPEQMEDKWFIFYEDGKLFFHRSWTGLCVFVMHFREQGDALVANRLDINKETADADSENLAFHLVEVLLLDRPGSMPGNGNPMKEWAVMGRAAGFVRHMEENKKRAAKTAK